MCSATNDNSHNIQRELIIVAIAGQSPMPRVKPVIGRATLLLKCCVLIRADLCPGFALTRSLSSAS